MSTPESIGDQAAAAVRSHLAAIVESSDDAIISKDLNGIIISWNRGAETIFGYPASEMVGTSIRRLIPPDRQAEEDYILGKIKRGEKVEHFETLRRTKDGRLINMSVTTSPIRDADGNVIGASKIARDTTAQKVQQEEILRLSRLYSALSEVNQAIVWTRSRDELFEKVCRVLVELGHFSMAWIGQPEAETRRVQVVARWGDQTDALAQVMVYADDRPEGHGPTGVAIREGTRDVRNDFINDTGHPQWRAWARRADYRAAAAFPIRQNGNVWGALTVYSGEAGFFRNQEIALLEEAAGDVSFALDNLAREQALRENEERYQALFDRSLDCVFLNDFAGNFLDANQAMLDLLGYQRADLAGLNFAALLAEAQLPLAMQVTEEIKTTGHQKRPAEFRLRGKDGRQVYVETRSSLIYRAGQPFAIQGIARDLTERKRALEELRLLNSAVWQAKESVMITDAQLDLPGPKIVFVNPAFTQMTGYSSAEVIGQTPRILQGPRTDQDLLARLRETLERGEVFDGEAIQYRKDGTEYVQEWQIAPLRDAEGKITHYLAIQRDISAHRKLEAQFRQSQKMEAFGQLAGGVAHDFNNILAVIQLQAGLLRAESNLSLEQLESAREIEQAAARAANLTRQLLLFSRKQSMQPRSLELKEVVENISRMLRRTLGEQIQLQLKYAGEPLLIHADPGMMDQILLNLVVNARDALPPGGQIIIETSVAEFDEVTATQSVQARPGRFACLGVSDTGCGIPPEILPRIFEPFFTTKEVGKGTGLGLATVFGIVQQHQGWINVYSVAGRGTTFRVYLPRQTKPNAPEFGSSPRAALRGGSETILLVEDELAVRSSVRITLTRLGYHVLEAADGAEALAVWQQHRDEIRLLLSDLVMPGEMTGKELAAQLLQQNPQLKVIYASGYSAEVAGKDLLLKEGVNYLAKPFNANQLAQTIRDRLDQPA